MITTKYTNSAFVSLLVVLEADSLHAEYVTIVLDIFAYIS